jgi:hypothetical protein
MFTAYCRKSIKTTYVAPLNAFMGGLFFCFILNLVRFAHNWNDGILEYWNDGMEPL